MRRGDEKAGEERVDGGCALCTRTGHRRGCHGKNPYGRKISPTPDSSLVLVSILGRRMSSLSRFGTAMQSVSWVVWCSYLLDIVAYYGPFFFSFATRICYVVFMLASTFPCFALHGIAHRFDRFADCPRYSFEALNYSYVL